MSEDTCEMTLTPLEWSCGCRAEPTHGLTYVGSNSLVGWVLHHCPLHGAAGELLSVCKKVGPGLMRLAYRAERRAANPDYDAFRWANEEEALNYRAVARDLHAALASAEPKPAKEASKT